MKITGILLAAGRSTRMAPLNKLTLPFRGCTIVEESLKSMIASSLENILIMIGHDYTPMKSLLSPYLSQQVRLVHNPEFFSGRATTIKCAIKHLDQTTEAALFMAADKPAIPAALINQAIQEFSQARPSILGVRTRQGRGHPIIFARELFDELLALKGDQVGLTLIEKHKDEMLWLEDDQEQINVNSQADYDRLLAQDKH